MPEKKVTINQLATMVQGGFEAIGAELGEMKGELKAELKMVGGRIDSIEIELIEIKKKLDNIVYRHEFEFLRDRVAVLEKQLAAKKK